MLHLCRSIASWVSSPSCVTAIKHRQLSLHVEPDSTLSLLADDVRDRLLDGERESSLVTETFALVREAARRRLGIEHRENQLNSAWHLMNREVVELPTGEGKTLAATPALALRALSGQGVWLATANDYLARRDAMAMQGVFELLGLSTGFVQALQSPDERRRAYACDITYGTIREFGFDFLRDRLSLRRMKTSISEEPLLQRGRFSMIVDEADSILLDDARTPLIISEPQANRLDEVVFQWSIATGRSLKDDIDYVVDLTSTKVWLTESGRARVRERARHDVLNQVTLPESYNCVAQGIEAERAFHLNRDYVVRDGKIVIVDRLNGRLAEGRQWQNGIQQSLEAANQVEITPDTNPVAKITVQTFLRGFHHLSGMTGTAQEAASEFRNAYRMRTVVISPFRPCLRKELPFQIKNTRDEKWIEVLSSVKEMIRQRRPVLIGTRDLNASEEISKQLQCAGIVHQVLTARQEADEAELISRAGQPGTITVSTSIAGRGTDISLGTNVAELGGLHVIAADLFDAARIDRQLAGRGGRQGDPATYQQILSMEDDLLKNALDTDDGRRRIARAMSSGPLGRLALMRMAQKRLEREHMQARRELLRHDRDRLKRHVELGFDPTLDDVES